MSAKPRPLAAPESVFSSNSNFRKREKREKRKKGKEPAHGRRQHVAGIEIFGNVGHTGDEPDFAVVFWRCVGHGWWWTLRYRWDGPSEKAVCLLESMWGS